MNKLFEPLSKVARNLLIVFVLYTISRIIFILANVDAFPGLNIIKSLKYCLAGLRFDCSAIMYTMLPYIVIALAPVTLRTSKIYKIITRLSYVMCAFVGLGLNIFDIVYFAFDGRRMTSTFFNEFSGNDNNFIIAVKGIISFWYLYLLGALVLFVLYRLYRGPVYRGRRVLPYYLTHSAIFLFSLGMAVAGMRGGFTHATRPISLSNANQYVDSPIEASIVLNTPFCIIRTYGKAHFEKKNYFSSEEEMLGYFNSVQTARDSSIFKAKNVCVLILESFSASYSSLLKKEQGSDNTEGYMPFLDSLMQQSLTYRWSFANGRKSIEAMPSTLSSIPSLIEPFFLTPYSTNEVSGIAGELVKNKGYEAAFFHGAPAGSMGFEAFSHITGYEKQYNMETFNDKSQFDGTWAIWDEPFLQYFKKEMDGFRQPFVSTIFTATSHHPFKIPKKYARRFAKGNVPIHRCVGYSDYALRRFFEEASKSDWYNNTIFVLTGDHTSITKQKDYKTNYGIFEIPILIFDPSGEMPRGIRDGIAQQADMMPTVLNFLGYDKAYIAFGCDLLNTPEDDQFAINYLNDCYQFFYGDYCMQFDGENEIALFNFKTDRLQENNLKGQVPEIENKMLNEAKALIQQYIQRMIDNTLVVK